MAVAFLLVFLAFVVGAVLLDFFADRRWAIRRGKPQLDFTKGIAASA